MEVTSKTQVGRRPKAELRRVELGPAGGGRPHDDPKAGARQGSAAFALSRLRSCKQRMAGERSAWPSLRDLLPASEDLRTRSAKPSAMGIWRSAPGLAIRQLHGCSNAARLEDELQAAQQAGEACCREQEMEEGDIADVVGRLDGHPDAAAAGRERPEML